MLATAKVAPLRQVLSRPSPHSNDCSYVTSVCADACQLGATFRDGDFCYEQLEGGPFRAVSTDVRVGPLQIAYEDVNRSVRYRGRSLRKARVFVARPRKGPDHYVNGRIAPPASICIEPVGTPSAAWCQGGLEAITVIVDDAALQAHLRAINPEHEPPATGNPTTVLEAPAVARRFVAQCSEVIEFARHMPGPESSFAQRVLVESTLDVLVECLLWEENETGTEAGTFFHAITVERAHDYIAARLDKPLTVLDVCHGLRISRRALQRSFQEVAGISPLQYLLQIRLNRVHRELLQRPEGTGVSDIATRWGFWHMSRFAHFYRRCFGVLPSQTRTRALAASPIRY